MCRSSSESRDANETGGEHKLKLKEAERLLRGAESLARLATSLLQSVTSASTTTKPNESGDLVMGNGDSNAD